MIDINQLDRRIGANGPGAMSRRQALQRTGLGMGWVALQTLLADQRPATASEVAPATPIAPESKAKSVIFLFMAGGPSHVDTFDPKPLLSELDGQETPESISKLFQRSATMGNGTRKLMASPFTFARYGQSGLPVSELFPEIAQHVDDICFLRSIQHDTVIHVPGEYILTTGSIVGDRPSLGAWIMYGLGCETENLPGYVVFGNPPRPTIASGFLPARYQATVVSEGETPIPNLRLPTNWTREQRREQLDLIQTINDRHFARIGGADSELEARIASYELAFRMQAAAPEAFDIGQETSEVHRLYGLDADTTRPIGAQCLMARRLVERGVRFIQVHVPGWDSHENLKGEHTAMAAKTDRPIAGLLADLRRRGLLESTLVVWGGEFGRTPGVEKQGGRDHSPGGFTMWLAGGGVRGGQAIGETDPVGYTAIERPIHPNSLHATILHALGVDQNDVYFTHNGRREIPTFLPAEVVLDAFA